MHRPPFQASDPFWKPPTNLFLYLGEVVDDGDVEVSGVVVLAGGVVEGVPAVPAESPLDVGLLPVVPLLVAPVVPCMLVLLPLVLLGSMLEPMLPGCWVLCVPCVSWVPLVPVCTPVCELELDPVPCVPMLPAVPVPAPLPVVWASAKVPSESVATQSSFRIVSVFSLS